MNRRRALILSTRLPWPLDDGGRIVLWQSVCAVARAFDTTLVSLVPPADCGKPIPSALASLGLQVVRVPHRPPWMPVALVRGAIGRWPYTLARYRSRVLDATLRRLVAEQRPSLAFVNALHCATHLDALGSVPVILRAQNLEHVWLARYADRMSNPAVRAYARGQARRMRRVEGELCSRCRLVLAIHEIEAEAFRQLVPSTRVEVIPVGIDMDRYLTPARERPPIVALIGSWEWAPNIDGGRRFLERGLRRVRERVPDARLRIVGKGLSSALVKAGRRAGAEVVGYVEDMAPEFARASVMVVPLWMGAGARVKIVEALAARLPVVTTTLGAEGLGLTPGVHALFADTPEGLGDAVGDLLAAPDRAQAMADAGYALAHERFSLEAVDARTVALCESVIAAPGGAG